jgi:hypothetical protein
VILKAQYGYMPSSLGPVNLHPKIIAIITVVYGCDKLLDENVY